MTFLASVSGMGILDAQLASGAYQQVQADADHAAMYLQILGFPAFQLMMAAPRMAFDGLQFWLGLFLNSVGWSLIVMSLTLRVLQGLRKGHRHGFGHSG